jgi:enoyl-[acyl-carrier-protein] reductase (NADH)
MNLGELHRREYGCILAGLIRVVKDFDLAEVANVAAFMASDRASAMTRTVVNVTCGAIVD